MELGPWHDGPDVHEAAKVEQHIDARVDFVVSLLCLPEVFAVPVQSIASDEAGQKVVSANGATGTDDEEAQGGGEQDVGLVVDPLPVNRLEDILDMTWLWQTYLLSAKRMAL